MKFLIFVLFMFCNCYDEIIGIDFGSTTSCISHFENGKVKIIQNEQGNSNTPSVASLIGDNIINGEYAKQQMIPNPKNTFYAIKKLIRYEKENVSANNYSFNDFTFEIIRNNDEPVIKKYNSDKTFSLDYIISTILTSMKQIAQNYLDRKVKRAVISVPAYFNQNQIDIIKKANIKSGFNIVKIVKEPIASVIAYGLNQRSNKSQKILVYHLGGYTHDVTLLSIDDSYIKVLDSQYTDEICGYNFDNRIVKYLINNFENKTGINISNDQTAIEKLYSEAEKAKKLLISVPKVRIMINNLYDGQILSDKITRDQFEEINEDLFQKTLNLIKSVLYKTNINKEEIDGIILSGGSTKIFKIQKIITDFFKDKKIYSNINPEEVVAYGIGLISGSLSGDINSRNIIKISIWHRYILL